MYIHFWTPQLLTATPHFWFIQMTTTATPSTVSEIFHTNNTFNPDDKTNIAHWLNNEFLNGEGSAQNGNKSVFDQTAAQYALVNDWYVEGNGKGEDANYKTTSVTQNDYTATCKIALLSYSEYVKYQGKIGYKATTSIANAGDRVLLRSPNTNTFLTMNNCRRVVGANTDCRSVVKVNISCKLVAV